MTEEHVKKLWETEWTEAENIEASTSFIGIILRKQRLKHVQNILNRFDRNSTIIDMGCGAGTTLKLMKDMGFKNAIGIDFSLHALSHCENVGLRLGKDVFNEDAKSTSFEDRQFFIVFEEGLWEHFENPLPFIHEAARICEKWMLIIQPNHFTLTGWLMHELWKHFNKGGVYEYSFRMKFFIRELEKLGFELRIHKRDMLWAQDVILFERVN